MTIVRDEPACDLPQTTQGVVPAGLLLTDVSVIADFVLANTAKRQPGGRFNLDWAGQYPLTEWAGASTRSKIVVVDVVSQEHVNGGHAGAGGGL